MKKLKGVIVPLITPYLNGKFDKKSFLNIADNSLRAGVDGLFILGTTGEFYNIPMKLKKKIIDLAVKKYSSRTKILVGTICKTFKKTFELIKYIEKNKVDALVLAPKYQIESDSMEFIRKILDKTNFPIFLYNNPKITDGKMLDFYIVKKLSLNPKIIGIKDSSSNLNYFSNVVGLKSNSFSVFQGSETILEESLNLDIDGIVSGFANFDPELMIRIHKKKRDKDFEKMNKIRRRYYRYGLNVKAIKHFAYEKGLIASDELVNN